MLSGFKSSDLIRLFDNMLVLKILLLSVFTTFVDKGLNFVLYGTIILTLLLFYFRNKLSIEWNIVPLVSILMLGCLSTIFNELYSSDGINIQFLWRPFRLIFSVLVGYYYARLSTKDSRRLLYYSIYFFMMIAVTYGIYQYYAGIGWGYNSRMDSFFGHPITYGSLLLITFWSTFYLFRKSLFSMLLLLYVLIGLLSTGSRSAWFALVFSILIYYFNRKCYKITLKNFIWLSIIVLLMIVFANSTYYLQLAHYLSERFSGFLYGISATQRLGSYIYIFDKIIDSNILQIMFGHGEGSASEIMGNTVISISSFYTTDCQYLTILYDYGLIPFVLLLYYICILYKNFIINNYGKFQKGYNELDMLSLCIMSGGILTSVFYDSCNWLSISTLVMLYVGIYICEMKKVKIITYRL